MKNLKLREELLLILLALLPVFYIFLKWNELPVEIPIHFDMNGNPNGYGSKWVVVGLSIGIYLLMMVLPKLDPRKENYELFRDSYFKLRLIMGFFFALINCGILYKVLHPELALNKLVPLSCYLLFMLIGNLMGNIRQNYFVGIKVPWTLNNEEVWRRTHKLAGYIWFWGGLIGAILTLVVDEQPWSFFFVLLLIMVLIPTVYSYVIYQKIEATHKEEK